MYNCTWICTMTDKSVNGVCWEVSQSHPVVWAFLGNMAPPKDLSLQHGTRRLHRPGRKASAPWNSCYCWGNAQRLPEGNSVLADICWIIVSVSVLRKLWHKMKEKIWDEIFYELISLILTFKDWEEGMRGEQMPNIINQSLNWTLNTSFTWCYQRPRDSWRISSKPW